MRLLGSLRWRLSLLFIGMTVAMMLFHGLVVRDLFVERFKERRKAELRATVEGMSWDLSAATEEDGEGLAERFRAEIEPPHPHAGVYLLDRDGAELAFSGPTWHRTALPEDLVASLSGTRELTERELSDEFLLAARRVPGPGAPRYLVAVSQMQPRGPWWTRGRGDPDRPPPPAPPGEDRTGGGKHPRRHLDPLPHRGPDPTEFLLRTSALLFLVAILTGILGVRLLTSRLQVLDHGVTRLAEGDLSVRLDPGAADEIGHVICSFNHMAESLERAREELAGQERARRELLADVSHELRTPLTGMLCQLELLCETSRSLPEEERARLEAAILDGRALSQRIDDLLTLARSEVEELPLETRRVNLQRLLNDLVRRSRAVLEEVGVTLEVDFSSEILEVEADPVRLEQVFTNLIDNARAVLTHGGRITVRVREQGEHAAVEVEDDGPGIPADELESLFERFQRGSGARGGGTGLGLAIVRRLVERHQGRVEVESQEGEGSTFRVLLPLAGS